MILTLDELAASIMRGGSKPTPYTTRAVRYWIERGELEAYAVGRQLYVVDEWQFAGWMLGRLKLYRAWVQGVSPGRRPRRGWEIRRGQRFLRATVHAKIEHTPEGPRPYKARTWFVGWSGTDGDSSLTERTYRTPHPQHFRRWFAGEILRLWEAEPALRAWRSRAWRPAQVPDEDYAGASEPPRPAPRYSGRRMARSLRQWPFRPAPWLHADEETGES